MRTLALYVAALKKHDSALDLVPTALRYEVFTQLIAQDPAKATKYRHRRAMVATAQRDFALALADCNEVIQHQPTWATAYFLRANALHELGQWRPAFHDAQTVVALDDTYPWVNNLLGLLYQCAGCPSDVPAAIAAFGREIELQPDAVKPLINRAELYLKQGDIDRAMADLSAALQRQAANPRALYLRGYVAYKGRNQEAALADMAASKDALLEARYTESSSDKPAGKPFTDYPPYSEFSPAASACTATHPDTLGALRDAQQWHAAITERPALIKLLPRELRTPELYALAVERDTQLVMQVPAALMTPHFYVLAIQVGGIDIDKVPPDHLSEAAWIAAIAQHNVRLEDIPDTWRTLAVCTAAYQAAAINIKHVPEALRRQVYKAAGKGWLERKLENSLHSGRGLPYWARTFQVLKMFATSSWHRTRSGHD